MHSCYCKDIIGSVVNPRINAFIFVDAHPSIDEFEYFWKHKKSDIFRVVSISMLEVNPNIEIPIYEKLKMKLSTYVYTDIKVLS